MRTLDPRRPAARAVAVAGGRILALGDVAAVRRAAGPRAQRLDGGGATVLPGLIDPHLHLLALAARHGELDCGAAGSCAALLEAVARAAAGLPRDAWVRGHGLDETALDRLPGAAALARAAGGRPVRLRHRSLHASLLDATAIRRVAAAGATALAAAARAGDGLVGGREAELRRYVGPVDEATLAEGLRDAGRALAAAGLTTVADATPRGWTSLGPLRRAIACGDVPQRVVAMRPPGGGAWRGDERLRPGPVKLLVDEVGRGLRPSAATLARRIAAAAARGDAVAVHCTTAAMLVAALEGFAGLPASRRRGRGHRLEHVGECPPPLVDEIARLGLAVVTNPGFVATRGDVYRDEHPAVAWPWLYRARSLAAAGIPLAAGSDAPVGPVSPWATVAAARRRRTPSGAVLGPAERLDAAAALALCTTGAADVLGLPHLGRLRVGAPADLVAVTPDPLRAAPDAVAATRVRLTIADGRVVWAA